MLFAHAIYVNPSMLSTSNNSSIQSIMIIYQYDLILVNSLMNLCSILKSNSFLWIFLLLLVAYLRINFLFFNYLYNFSQHFSIFFLIYLSIYT